MKDNIIVVEILFLPSSSYLPRENITTKWGGRGDAVGDPGFHKGGCIVEYLFYFVNVSFEWGLTVLDQTLAIM